MQRLTAGMAVLLLDGSAKGLAFSVQSLKFRSVEEPSGEGDLRGSREGFSDLLRVNPEPAAAAHPHRSAGDGSAAGRLRDENGICRLLLQR